MSRTRLARPALALAATAVLLSGCGAAQPGVAAQIGEETIALSQVDDAAQAVCRSFEEQLRSSSQLVPMSQMRQYSLSLLAASSEARQIAEEYGVEPDAAFQTEVANYTRTAANLPEELREVYVEVMTAEALVTSVIAESGEAALVAEGVVNPTTEQAAQRGSDIFSTWPDVNGVEVDPRFGLKLVDGQLQLAETSLSVPVSEVAVEGGAEQPGADFVGSLPVGHRCG